MNIHCIIRKTNRKSSSHTDYEKALEFLKDTGLMQKEIVCPKLTRRKSIWPKN